MRQKKLLLVSCAGLDTKLAERSPVLRQLAHHPLRTVFPAVTCSAQATMRTGLTPAEHGIICNGHYSRETFSVAFWGQSSQLMPTRRIWDGLRARGGKAGVLFHQQSLGDSTDIVLSPAPIHKHGGGMVMGCHSIPAALESEATARMKQKFQLWRYWGPLASAKVGSWCAGCTATAMQLYSPDILMTYLPDMDYVLQRQGPDGKDVQSELNIFSAHCQCLLDAAKAYGYEVAFWGDYSISEVSQVIYPNRILLEAGLFAIREVKGHLYPNLYDSKAFAMTDHQVAHIYIREPAHQEQMRQLFANMPDITAVQTAEEAGLAHRNSGELVLTAAQHAWFAYKWWNNEKNAPDYAHHIDIHSKIGYDPCELFWKIPMLTTESDCTRIRGSHGRDDKDAVLAVSSGAKSLLNANTLVELAKQIEEEVNELC